MNKRRVLAWILALVTFASTFNGISFNSYAAGEISEEVETLVDESSEESGAPVEESAEDAVIPSQDSAEEAEIPVEDDSEETVIPADENSDDAGVSEQDSLDETGAAVKEDDESAPDSDTDDMEAGDDIDSQAAIGEGYFGFWVYTNSYYNLDSATDKSFGYESIKFVVNSNGSRKEYEYAGDNLKEYYWWNEDADAQSYSDKNIIKEYLKKGATVSMSIVPKAGFCVDNVYISTNKILESNYLTKGADGSYYIELDETKIDFSSSNPSLYLNVSVCETVNIKFNSDHIKVYANDDSTYEHPLDQIEQKANGQLVYYKYIADEGYALDCIANISDRKDSEGVTLSSVTKNTTSGNFLISLSPNYEYNSLRVYLDSVQEEKCNVIFNVKDSLSGLKIYDTSMTEFTGNIKIPGSSTFDFGIEVPTGTVVPYIAYKYGDAKTSKTVYPTIGTDPEYNIGDGEEEIYVYRYDFRVAAPENGDLNIDVFTADAVQLTVKYGKDDENGATYTILTDDENNECSETISKELDGVYKLPKGIEVSFSTEVNEALFEINESGENAITGKYTVNKDTTLYLKDYDKPAYLYVNLPAQSVGIEDVKLYYNNNTEYSGTKDGDKYVFSYSCSGVDTSNLTLLVKPQDNYDLFFKYTSYTGYTTTHMKDSHEDLIYLSDGTGNYPAGYYVLKMDDQCSNDSGEVMSYDGRITLLTKKMVSVSISATVDGEDTSDSIDFGIYNGNYPADNDYKSNTIAYYGQKNAIMVSGPSDDTGYYMGVSGKEYSLKAVYAIEENGTSTKLELVSYEGITTVSLTPYSDVTLVFDFTENYKGSSKVTIHTDGDITDASVYACSSYEYGYWWSLDEIAEGDYDVKNSVSNNMEIEVSQSWICFKFGEFQEGKRPNAVVVLDEGTNKERSYNADDRYSIYAGAKTVDIYLSTADKYSYISLEEGINPEKIDLFTYTDSFDGISYNSVDNYYDAETGKIKLETDKKYAVLIMTDTASNKLYTEVYLKEDENIKRCKLLETYNSYPIYEIGKITSEVTLSVEETPGYTVSIDEKITSGVEVLFENDEYKIVPKTQVLRIRNDNIDVYGRKLVCNTEGFTLRYDGIKTYTTTEGDKYETEWYSLLPDSDVTKVPGEAVISFDDNKAERNVTVNVLDTKYLLGLYTSTQYSNGELSCADALLTAIPFDSELSAYKYRWNGKNNNLFMVKTINYREPVVKTVGGDEISSIHNCKNIYVYDISDLSADIELNVDFKRSSSYGNIVFRGQNALARDASSNMMIYMLQALEGNEDDLDYFDYAKKIGSTYKFTVEPYQGYLIDKVTCETNGIEAELESEGGVYSLAVGGDSIVRVYASAKITDEEEVSFYYSSGMLEVEVLDTEADSYGRYMVKIGDTLRFKIKMLNEALSVSAVTINKVTLTCDYATGIYSVVLTEDNIKNVLFAGKTYNGIIPVTIKLKKQVSEQERKVIIDRAGIRYALEDLTQKLSDVQLPNGWTWENPDMNVTKADDVVYYGAIYNDGDVTQFVADLPVMLYSITGLEIDSKKYYEKNTNAAFSAEFDFSIPSINAQDVIPDSKVTYTWSVDAGSGLTISDTSSQVTNINTGAIAGVKTVKLKAVVGNTEYQAEKTFTVLEAETNIDYEPIIEDKKLTVNKDAEKALIAILCKNGNMVKSAQLLEGGNTSANFEVVSVGEEGVYFRVKAGSAYKNKTKAQTYPVTLKLVTDKASYDYSLSISVSVTQPSCTIKQTGKLNTFYKDSYAAYSVSSGYEIENIVIGDASAENNNMFSGGFDPENSVLFVSPVNMNETNYASFKNKSVSVNVIFKGFDTPVKKTLKVASVNTQCTLQLPAVLVTGSLRTVGVNVEYKSTGEKVDLTRADKFELAKTYSGLTINGIDPGTKGFTMTYTGERTLKSYSVNVKLPEWTQTVNVSGKINVASSPELALEKSTLIMNRYSFDHNIKYEIPVYAKLGEFNFASISVSGKDAKSKKLITDNKLVVEYDSLAKVLKVYGGTANAEVVPGTYTFVIDGKVDDGQSGITAKSCTLKVKVMAANTDVKFKTSGTINPVQLHSSTTVKMTVSNTTTTVENVELVGNTSYVINYNGGNLFTVTKKTEDTIVTSGQKTELTVKCTMSDGENLEKKISIKPVIAWPKMKATVTKGILYRGCDKTLVSRINVTSNSAQKYVISGIEIVPDTKGYYKNFDVRYSEGNAYVSLKPEADKMAAGKYTVTYKIHMIGEDGIVANSKLSMKVTVK